METIEVVIRIPKGCKELVDDMFGNNGLLPTIVKQELLGAVSLGTVLPKGHGRLIDADDVVQKYRKQVMVSMSEGEMLDLLIDLFEDSATVIEAEREEKK